MSVSVAEKDWKYLRSVQAELLSALYERVNLKAMEILQSEELSSREKYRALFRHMEDSDRIVAKCFDDWRRSTIWLKIRELHHNYLLTEAHLRHLSQETRELIDQLNETN